MNDEDIICENCGENLSTETYECEECFNQVCEVCANICKNCGGYLCDGCYRDHRKKCN